MKSVYYVSNGKLYKHEESKSIQLAAGAVDAYKETIKELQRRREWKSTGRGAAFMGMLQSFDSGEVHAGVEAVACGADGKIIYAATLEQSCALYAKDPEAPQEAEDYIVRKNDTRFYHIDYDPVDGAIVCSANDGYIEKHLALCYDKKANFRYLSEGESVEITPSFSRADNKLIHFSTAGYYVEAKTRKVHYSNYSNYSIGTFDLRTNELEELHSDPKYDYLFPLETAGGVLYCIRRPKETQGEKGPSVSDVLLVPVRVLRTFFGWLNFTSQKYTGESLLKQTKGQNPAKHKEASDEEIFIEGNLINATKTQKENALKGEEFPGSAPQSWELVTLSRDGTAKVVKKGVLGYTVDDDGTIYYSNGKYIMRRNPDGREENICEAKVAKSLCVR